MFTKNEDEEYATRSIAEAGFLYLHGVELLSAIDHRGYELFSFKNDGSVQKLLEQFFNDGVAPARSYAMALAQLHREAGKARQTLRNR